MVTMDRKDDFNTDENASPFHVLQQYPMESQTGLGCPRGSFLAIIFGKLSTFLHADNKNLLHTSYQKTRASRGEFGHQIFTC